jgi:hypothetical protein
MIAAGRIWATIDVVVTKGAAGFDSSFAFAAALALSSPPPNSEIKPLMTNSSTTEPRKPPATRYEVLIFMVELAFGVARPMR